MLDAILLLLIGDYGAPECYASAARIKVLLLLGRIAMLGWWRGSVVERRSLAGELSLSCARPAADG